MSNKIIVVGIGPGSPDYLLPKAKIVINQAEVLVGGRRALAEFSQADKLQKCLAITRDLASVMNFIARELKEHDVVVMVSGDPGYYSLLDALQRNFEQEKIEVIPGISAMQLAFSRLALPWHDAKLLSFHGRVPLAADIKYQKGLLLGLLTDTKYTSHSIPELLLVNGWPKESKLYICERLSYPDECIEMTTLVNAKKLKEAVNCILIVKG